ncbi:hypothetical protein [Lysobacter xanthus]
MRRYLVPIALVLVAGCSRPEAQAPAAAEANAPAPAVAASPSSVLDAPVAAPAAVRSALPAQACSLDGYEAFFEAFAQNQGVRASMTAPGVDARTFDIELRDNGWINRASPDVPLDIRQSRDGEAFVAEAVPVERGANDEVVKELGPGVRYRFEFAEGCWRYAGRD